MRLSLRLYLDECAYSKRLANILRSPPYNYYVETPVESGLKGRSDEEHLVYASSHGLILVTKDTDDFKALHRQRPHHPGILVIYQGNLPSDMSDYDVARAIQNLGDAGAPIAGVFQNLNAWNY
jgi:predicted nuclease of predicted toxin-antitoxin system